MARMFRAVESFEFTGHDGARRVVTVGTLMSDDDPDFKRIAPHRFEPVGLAAARPRLAASETASAEPGRRRALGWR